MSDNRWSLAVGAWLAVMAALPVAQAQDATRDDEARALFDAGQVAYTAGRFADAERYFRQSYELSGRTVLLFNIALSADQARHDDVAVEAYRAFLEAHPGSDRAARARTRLQALTEGGDGDETSDGEAIEPAPGATGAETSAGPTSRGGAGPNVGGIVLLAGGGAALVTGAVLVGVAAADVASVENAERGSSWSDVEGAYGRSEALSIAGFVLLGVGAAAAAVGVVLMVAGGDDSEASARLRVGPGSLQLEGTF